MVAWLGSNGCNQWEEKVLGWEGWMVGERGELRWASILPGLGEGRRQPYGLGRLREPPPTPTPAWLVLKGKVCVQWRGQTQ